MKYTAARNILSVLIIVGWAIVGLGALVSLIFASQSGQGLVFVYGVIISAVYGFTMIGFSQVGIALLDTAENSYKILDALKGTAGGSAVSSRSSFTASGHIKFYKGFDLVRTEEGVKVGDQVFSGVIAAEKWIDAQSKEEK